MNSTPLRLTPTPNPALAPVDSVGFELEDSIDASDVVVGKDVGDIVSGKDKVEEPAVW